MYIYIYAASYYISYMVAAVPENREMSGKKNLVRESGKCRNFKVGQETIKCNEYVILKKNNFE